MPIINIIIIIIHFTVSPFQPSQPVKDNTDLYFLRNSVIGDCIFNNIISSIL